MKAKFSISACGTPNGCHAFKKGSDITVKLSVYGIDCDEVWFYIGNDERVLRGGTAFFKRLEGGFESIYRFRTESFCRDEGLLFCHFEFVSGGKRYFTAFDDSFECYITDHFVNEAQILVYDELYESPEWLMQGSVYQIFPDRFARGGVVSRRSDAVYDENWNDGIPEYPEVAGDAFPNNTHFGGTLFGVVNKLDYLESLGINCIYLNPIFDAYSNHKYDTCDFLKVDRTFGGERALAELVERAHERGMHVVLDGVFNHVGDDSIYFDAYGKYGTGACSFESSPYRDWFTFKHYPDDYESWWGIKNLPRIVRCEGYIRFITESVIPKYMRLGVDGWRLDVVDELEGEFLERITASVKCRKSDAVIIGEVWEDASNKIAYDERKRYFRGKQLDSVTDYPIRNAIIEFVKNGNSRYFANTVKQLYRNYPPHKLACLFNYLGSHDTDRITTVLGGESGEGLTNSELAVKRLSPEKREVTKELLKQAYLLLASIPGVPCLFYGDEIAMEGYHDPFCRRTFPWEREHKGLLEHYRRLGELRNIEKAFDRGEFRVLEHGAYTLAYERSKEDSHVVVLANGGNDNYRVRIDGKWIDMLSYESYENLITVKPHTARIMKKI